MALLDLFRILRPEAPSSPTAQKWVKPEELTDAQWALARFSDPAPKPPGSPFTAADPTSFPMP